MATREEIRKLSELASIRHRGTMLARNLWKHVWDVHEKVSATSLGRPLEGCTAVVVGAGPSLDKTVEHLHDYQQHVCVIAVNTAVKALLKADVRPDVVVTIETVDTSKHIPEDEGLLVLTTPTAHPNVWRRGAWFTVEGSIAMTRLCRFWGVPPGTLGVAAATTALSQALDWGASNVLLMGLDLAVSEQMYATGSAWEHVKAKVADEGSGHGERVYLDNPAERDQAFKNEGVAPPSRMRSAPIEIEGWHGETVQTVGEFLTQVDWFERRAKSSNVPIINCTEGGARLVGTEIMHARPALHQARSDSEIPPEMGTLGGRTIPEESRDAAIQDVLKQCAEAMQWCGRYLSGMFFPCPAIPDVPAVLEFAFPGVIGMADRIKAAMDRGDEIPPPAHVVSQYSVLAGAAAQLARYLSGEPWEIQNGGEEKADFRATHTEGVGNPSLGGARSADSVG